MQGFQTVIVVPCYNEAERLRTADFDKFLLRYPQVGFLFVDDGSRDLTHELLVKWAGQNERVMVHRLVTNVGKAEAVRQGILVALHRMPEVDLIGYMDADLATPLSEIAHFRDLFEAGGDHLLLVMGSRVRLLGRKIERSLKRHYVSRVFATIASFLLQIPVYDTQCGAKLFRRNVAAFVFEDPFESRWLFDVEILVRFLQLLYHRGQSRYDIEYFALELPVSSWINARGSKVKVIDLVRSLWDLAFILHEKRQRLGSYWLK